MNQRAISDSILQLQAKGDVFTRQVIIEQRRVDDIDGVSSSNTLLIRYAVCRDAIQRESDRPHCCVRGNLVG